MTEEIELNSLNRRVTQEFRANSGTVTGMFEGREVTLDFCGFAGGSCAPRRREVR